MIALLLANPLRSALIAALTAAITFAGLQTWRLSSARNDATKAQEVLVALQLSIQTAAAESTTRAAQSAVVVTQTLKEKTDEDRPVVERVVNRIVRQCAPNRDLPLPAVAGGAGPPRGEAQDDGRGAFAQELADDLATCQGELNRLDVMRSWVKANGG